MYRCEHRNKREYYHVLDAHDDSVRVRADTLKQAISMTDEDNQFIHIEIECDDCGLCEDIVLAPKELVLDLDDYY